ncbi:hypothetical protein A5703_11670 [Mycobacterium sp. E188]|nr:hypothetical protein A5703_11670 [Mycobacterium sp. E188]OBH38118.1 hypothetical protein A5691_24490 [Mycobacterium sp. E183]
MAGDLTPNFGGKLPGGQHLQWQPPHAIQRTQRSRAWPAIVLAAVALSAAVAALAVAIMRPTTPAPASTASTAPTYTSADAAAAQKQMCDAYSRAARAVQIESNGGGVALARIATVNGAAMLETAAAAPALKPDDRTAALALARTYRDLTAVGSVVNGSGDPAWQAAIADVNAADGAMKKLCGG